MLATYVDSGVNSVGTPRALVECMKTTKSTQRTKTGADLAGACEGEQIAQLIDLVRATAQGLYSHLTIKERAESLIAEIEARAKR